MPNAIQITVTDVINRLHHLKGDDRLSLLLEHLESLIFEEGEEEILWFEPLPLLKEEEK
tara:strand:- start:210 stop:386 length:177 start_codon:yes stop_codon:yes gene_type:complete